MPATADVFEGRRLQKQDTRPSGNPAPAFNNEHSQLGSGRWHDAGPRDTQDPVERLPGALLHSLPSRPHRSSPRHRVAHGQDHDGREGQALQQHGPTRPHRRRLRSQPHPRLQALSPHDPRWSLVPWKVKPGP